MRKKKTSPIKIRSKKLSLSAPIEEHKNDFFKWTRNQARVLKNREFSKLDIDNLIEEIKSLGNSEKNAIESYLIVLFVHLLKIDHQPSMRSKSWDNSVENAKFRIQRLIEKNPSLKKTIAECVDDAYFSARLQASSETGLNKENFPEKCPWKMQNLFPYLKLKFKKS